LFSLKRGVTIATNPQVLIAEMNFICWNHLIGFSQKKKIKKKKNLYV
jgi:hypothetical protein